MTKEVGDRWIIVVHTLCMGDQPAWWDIHEDQTESPGYSSRPLTYATEREAWKEIADDYMTKLSEFLEDESQESFDLSSDYSVMACTVHEDGVITTEDHGKFYDPMEDQAKYGRS